MCSCKHTVRSHFPTQLQQKDGCLLKFTPVLLCHFYCVVSRLIRSCLATCQLLICYQTCWLNPTVSSNLNALSQWREIFVYQHYCIRTKRKWALCIFRQQSCLIITKSFPELMDQFWVVLLLLMWLLFKSHCLDKYRHIGPECICLPMALGAWTHFCWPTRHSSSSQLHWSLQKNRLGLIWLHRAIIRYVMQHCLLKCFIPVVDWICGDIISS